jgi:YYY domain-containing protein
MVRRHAWHLLLVLCALVGLTARLWNLDFDQRQHLQPDERHWVNTSGSLAVAPAPDPHGTVVGPVLDWLDGDRSPANVYRGTESFAYGPITLAAARGVSGWLHEGVVTGDQPAALIADTFDAIGVDLIDDDGRPRFDDSYQVDLVGRLLGALLDTITIVVVGLIGRRLGGRRAGVAAAALYATCVLAIQHAHFLGAEPLVGLAGALTVLATLRLDRGAQVWSAVQGGALAGAAAGLAISAKLTGAGVALVPLVLCAWLVYRHRRRADLARLLSVVLATLIAVRVANPGAFQGLSWSLKPAFVDDFWASQRVADLDMPPAVQWANRFVVLDALRWLFVFTIGPGTCIAAVVGVRALWRGRAAAGRWNVAVMVAAVVVPAALVLRSFSPTGRYFMALAPALHAIGGVGLVSLWGVRSPTTAAARRAGAGSRRLFAAAVGRWRPAAAALLAGSALLWGAAFVNGVYGHDNTRIVASRWMQDHIPPGAVVSSQAWDDALPLAIAGVDTGAWPNEQFDLFGVDDVAKIEHLADQLATVDYVIESSPRVWATVPRIPVRYPSTINFFAGLDDGTLGFERVATFTSAPRLSLFGVQWWRLDDTHAEEAFTVYDHPEVRIWQRVRDVDQAEILRVLDVHAAANAIHVSPQNARANGLTLFPDEQSANATVGTFADDFDVEGSPWWHLLGWWLLLQLSAIAAFIVFLPLLRRLPDAGLGVSTMLGLAVPAVAVFVAVTWLGISFTRGLVAAVLAVWLLTAVVLGRRRVGLLALLWSERRRVLMTAAVLSTGTFAVFVLLRAMNPDLWHPYRAGEKPFELTMLTSMMRTRTLPPYDSWMSGGTLNYYYGGYLMLAVPGRLLRTAPTVVMNLAVGVFAGAAAGAAYTAGATVVSIGRRATSAASAATARWGGLCAAVFVLVLPNMAIVPGVFRRLVGTERGGFDWWAPSRVIPNSGAVTEFPAWSLLFSDVHPHVMDLPLLMTVMVLCLAWYRAAVERRAVQAVAAAAVVGLLVGLVRATNTWDYPLALAAAVTAVAAALIRRGDWRAAARDVAVAAFAVVGVWAPYAWRGEVYDAGVEPVTDPTPWASWAAHWSFFAVCTLLVAVPVLWRMVRSSPVMWGAVRQGHVLVLSAMFGLAGAWALAPTHATQLTSVALAVMALPAVLRGRERSARSLRLAAAMMAVGWAAIAVIEQFSVRNDGDRMNTVFKGWYQAWVLLAIGSAAAVVLAMRGTAAAREPSPETAPAAAGRRARGRPHRWVGLALVGFAASMSVAFAVLATPARLDDRVSADGLSLDGLAYFDSDLREGDSDRLLADDVPLLQWLQSNVRGIVPIAEAAGEDYRWNSRFATLTGLPTPIGWPYHERQQKRDYSSIVDLRHAEMTELYSTTDPLRVAEVLARYEIRYVVFGTVEQGLSPDGATVLAAPCVTEVFRSGVAFIASVDAQCLRALPLRE